MKPVETNPAEEHLFGCWQFNASTGILFDGKTTTRLEPQVGSLLDYFLTHQNTLTSRNELIARVWENRVVSDDAINRCISILRRILTPDEKNAYIETVVRRGFISHFPPSRAAKPDLRHARRGRHYLSLAVLASLILVFFYTVNGNFRASPEPSSGAQPKNIPMVAVLPFASDGMVADTAFFANGMHDDLITQLAQLQSIRVISRTSVLGYQDTHRNIRQIGQELGADAILEGRVQRIGDRIRLNVQLINAHTDQHLWARRFDRKLSPTIIFDVQAEIARAIASALQIALLQQDAEQLKVLPTENMAAYRAFHRAMEIRDSRNTTDPEYIKALLESVKLDPGFVRAWVELAGLYSLENFDRQDPNSIEHIEQILDKIRSLAPSSADYLIAQAYYTYYILKDYPRALQFINQAQNLRPSDVRLLELKSWIQRRLGDYQGMIETIRLSRALEPTKLRWTTRLVVNLIVTHQYEAADREIENTTARDFQLSVLHGMLQFRQDQDFDHWAEYLAGIQKEFGDDPDSEALWDSYIAIRDYATAEKTLTALDVQQPPRYRWRIASFSGSNILQIISDWLARAGDRLDTDLDRARAILNDRRDSNGDFLNINQNLAMAFVTAAAGDTPETIRLVRAWRSAVNADLAGLATTRHYACRALGMAAATAAAVKCIRSGIVAPSFVMPFLEPLLPYYDSIRDQPAFVSLLADTRKRSEQTSPQNKW